MTSLLPVCILLSALHVTAAANLPVCNVRDFGAAGDGQHKDTAAIQSAIESCAKSGGGTVFLPPGRYLTGAIIAKEATLPWNVGPGAAMLGSEDPADYPLHDSAYGGERKSISSLIYADGVEDVTLTGRGTIDGQGQIWWKRQWFAFPGRTCRKPRLRKTSPKRARSPTDAPA